MNIQPENLVFKGGGVLGIAYAGAIQVLEQKNILHSVTRVAGTSAGAITATLLSLGYNSNEITNIVNQTDFSSFQDGRFLSNALSFMQDYGYYKGDAFLKWMQGCVKAKGLEINATFSDLKNMGYRDLHVFATDLNINGLKEFSFTTTPNVPVAEAVRASMSIPLFFEAWLFSNGNPDNHVYVDGGMIYNYPITFFDSGDNVNPKTLGLFLSNLGPESAASNLKPGHFIEYIGAVVETMLNSQVINFKYDVEDRARSIIIDNLGISPTNFKLTNEQKTALFNSGVKYTTEFLEKSNATVNNVLA